MRENENNPPNTAPNLPKPVFVRLLMLFGGGVGCMFVGIIVSLVTGDLVLLALSAILCITMVIQGILLKRKANKGQIYSASGVCVSITPKMLGRYRRIELMDTATGNDICIVLPKKTVFKIGHVYTCYFDNQINNRPENTNNPQGSFFNADMDFPTNGFLGFEDFGIYQEKPAVVTNTTAAIKADAVENNQNNIEEED